MGFRDHLVLDHLPLVKVIAVTVHQNLPAYAHADVKDLVQSGILGLFDAASKYNPERQAVFSGYAKHRIKGAMLDSLRQLDWASRDMRRRVKRVAVATQDLTAALQRTPTEDEIAGKLGMTVERLRKMMLDLRDVGLVSASTRANEYLPAPEFPDNSDDQPDRIYARAELRRKLREAAKNLPRRYQEILRLYYHNELTMKTIGSMLGINESRVSQIHKVALEKMAIDLDTVGITSGNAF
jgi:RNA polymerase sigma factor for flagellar operon FliA